MSRIFKYPCFSVRRQYPEVEKEESNPSKEPMDSRLTETNPRIAKKETVGRILLPSEFSSVVPQGVELLVTKSPHRDGNPDHNFYEAWCNYVGGSCRSSSAIHEPRARGALTNYLTELTGVDQSAAVGDLLQKYVWN